MARVTVEDCIEKIDNRFDLVLMAAHRARMISAGSQITIDRDNDKNPVVSLREIGDGAISPEDLREDLIHSLQKYVEVDEPEKQCRAAARRRCIRRRQLRHDERRRAAARHREPRAAGTPRRLISRQRSAYSDQAPGFVGRSFLFRAALMLPLPAARIAAAMMRQYELVERVQAYNPHADEKLLNKAYVYAMQKHGSQKRASGDPYFNHPLEVAAILTDLKLDDATIAVGAAARHHRGHRRHPRRDRPAVRPRNRRDRRRPDQDRAPATSSPAKRRRPRTCASCCSPSRPTCGCCWSSSPTACTTCAPSTSCRPKSSKRIAEETMDIYAPLAGRMGMQDMRSPSSRTWRSSALQPDHYRAITDRLAECSRGSSRARSTIIKRELTEKLKTEGIDAKVSARVKSPWSICHQDRAQADRARTAVGHDRLPPGRYGPSRTATARSVIVHTNWKVVPGRFKDYISVPKHNDYRSIHTTIVGPGRQRIELQIRTEEMHRIAEYGIAAHAAYKEGADLSQTRQGEQGLRLAAPDHRASDRRAPARKTSSNTPSWSCSRTRCSASPRAAG